MRLLGSAAAIVSVAFLLGSLAAHAPAAEESKLPRYKLAVGDQIEFEGKSQFAFGSEAFFTRVQTVVTVLRANDDGSFRVAIRQATGNGRGIAGGEPDYGDERTNFAACDLFPDGRIAPNASLGFYIDPSGLFPPLPPDEQSLAAGWQATSDFNQTTRDVRPLTDRLADAGQFVFDVVQTTPLDAIYLSTAKSRDTFDRERGLIVRQEGENTQGYGFDGKGTSTVELTKVEKLDAAVTQQLAEDTDRYVAAKKRYDELLEQAAKGGETIDADLKAAEEALASAKASSTSKEIIEQIDADLANHPRMSEYTRDSAKRYQDVLAMPVLDWKTKDLAGNEHALADYRGKVLILDFWYRGCGWCIRAMPQVKEVAAHYRGQPVEVIGLTTDDKLEDANWVVEKMGLDYTNLHAEQIPNDYHVRGFPTLLVIDQQGKVRDVHVGYSPDLRETVIQSVDRLLAEGK